MLKGSEKVKLLRRRKEIIAILAGGDVRGREKLDLLKERKQIILKLQFDPGKSGSVNTDPEKSETELKAERDSKRHQLLDDYLAGKFADKTPEEFVEIIEDIEDIASLDQVKEGALLYIDQYKQA